MKTGCGGPTSDLSSAKRVESSPGSDSPGVFGARASYSSEIFSIAVIEITRSTRWQKAVTLR